MRGFLFVCFSGVFFLVFFSVFVFVLLCVFGGGFLFCFPLLQQDDCIIRGHDEKRIKFASIVQRKRHVERRPPGHCAPLVSLKFMQPKRKQHGQANYMAVSQV